MKCSVDGLERYTIRAITFAQPFSLGSSPDIYPAGTYEVEATERPVELGSQTIFVRTSTVLIVPTGTGVRWREVEPNELDRALEQDAEQGGQIEPSENPDRDRVGPLITGGAA